ncbi:MAG: BON domain-containing protein [Candidatus Aquicultorales bacterium]
MSKHQLRRRIYDAIALHPGVRNPIEVEIEGDVVRLKGVVSSYEERRLAETIAIQAGAEEIETDITIEEGVSTHPLSGSVNQALDEAGMASVAGVDRVIDGVVYLSGHADSAAQAERALSVASDVAGVRDVVSEIRLALESIPDESRLLNLAQQALADSGIHEENIALSAKGGIVYLDGVVWGAADKKLAEQAVKSVPGVRGAVNRLRAPMEPLSEDERVAWDVLERLEKAKVNVIDVSVVVAAGTAFLDGSVDSMRQKDQAGEIALATSGVLHIKNDLVVSAFQRRSA